MLTACGAMHLLTLAIRSVVTIHYVLSVYSTVDCSLGVCIHSQTKLSSQEEN